MNTDVSVLQSARNDSKRLHGALRMGLHSARWNINNAAITEDRNLSTIQIKKNRLYYASASFQLDFFSGAQPQDLKASVQYSAAQLASSVGTPARKLLNKWHLLSAVKYLSFTRLTDILLHYFSAFQKPSFNMHDLETLEKGVATACWVKVRFYWRQGGSCLHRGLISHTGYTCMEACRDLLNSAPTCCPNSHQLSEISKTGAAFYSSLRIRILALLTWKARVTEQSERNKEKEEVRSRTAILWVKERRKAAALHANQIRRSRGLFVRNTAGSWQPGRAPSPPILTEYEDPHLPRLFPALPLALVLLRSVTFPPSVSGLALLWLPTTVLFSPFAFLNARLES